MWIKFVHFRIYHSNSSQSPLCIVRLRAIKFPISAAGCQRHQTSKASPLIHFYHLKQDKPLTEHRSLTSTFVSVMGALKLRFRSLIFLNCFTRCYCDYRKSLRDRILDSALPTQWFPHSLVMEKNHTTIVQDCLSLSALETCVGLREPWSASPSPKGIEWYPFGGVQEAESLVANEFVEVYFIVWSSPTL